MSTLVVGPPPAELRALIERRRRAGADRLDEVWEDVDHMVPAPAGEQAVIASPGDESWQKLGFYARHDIDEVVIVDPAERTVAWLALDAGEYQRVSGSGLIDLGPSELAAKLDWA